MVNNAFSKWYVNGSLKFLVSHVVAMLIVSM